jgi:Zn-dependent M28 family amino/carboxypeptidase
LPVLILLMCVTIAGIASWNIYRSTHMPGRSYAGPQQPLTSSDVDLEKNLRTHVVILASDIGERNIPKYTALVAASNYIRREFESNGYKVAAQNFLVAGREVANLSVEIRGASWPDEVVVVGAHYDSVVGSPGANDNSSGTAAVLELSRMMHGRRLDRTIRFVLFANEEPPYFQTGTMGSVVYAQSLRQAKAQVVGMISIETIGCFSDAPHSQHYPPGIAALYSDKGNFIGFVSDTNSSALMKRAMATFRANASVPSEGLVAAQSLEGVGWSDHWSFWQQGYPAIMVTDTAPFRYAHYHKATDTPDKMDFDRMTRVVSGLGKVVEELATRR